MDVSLIRAGPLFRYRIGGALKRSTSKEVRGFSVLCSNGASEASGVTAKAPTQGQKRAQPISKMAVLPRKTAAEREKRRLKIQRGDPASPKHPV